MLGSELRLVHLVVNAEMKRVAEARKALAEQQMNCVEESCRRTHERLRRFKAIRALQKNFETQKALSLQKLRRLRQDRRDTERFAKCAICS